MPINFGNSRNSRIRNQQDVYQEERNAFDLLKLDIKQQDDALVKEIKANEQNFSDLATQLQDGNITQEELLGVRKSLGILEKEQGLSPFKDDSLLSAVNKRYISNINESIEFVQDEINFRNDASSILETIQKGDYEKNVGKYNTKDMIDVLENINNKLENETAQNADAQKSTRTLALTGYKARGIQKLTVQQELNQERNNPSPIGSARQIATKSAKEAAERGDWTRAYNIVTGEETRDASVAAQREKDDYQSPSELFFSQQAVKTEEIRSFVKRKLDPLKDSKNPLIQNFAEGVPTDEKTFKTNNATFQQVAKLFNAIVDNQKSGEDAWGYNDVFEEYGLLGGDDVNTQNDLITMAGIQLGWLKKGGDGIVWFDNQEYMNSKGKINDMNRIGARIFDPYEHRQAIKANVRKLFYGGDGDDDLKRQEHAFVAEVFLKLNPYVQAVTPRAATPIDDDTTNKQPLVDKSIILADERLEQKTPERVFVGSLGATNIDIGDNKSKIVNNSVKEDGTIVVKDDDTSLYNKNKNKTLDTSENILAIDSNKKQTYNERLRSGQGIKSISADEGIKKIGKGLSNQRKKALKTKALLSSLKGLLTASERNSIRRTGKLPKSLEGRPDIAEALRNIELSAGS